MKAGRSFFAHIGDFVAGIALIIFSSTPISSFLIPRNLLREKVIGNRDRDENQYLLNKRVDSNNRILYIHNSP